jgi:hypothetical protein
MIPLVDKFLNWRKEIRLQREYMKYRSSSESVVRRHANVELNFFLIKLTNRDRANEISTNGRDRVVKNITE